jgi:hypothetical protein
MEIREPDLSQTDVKEKFLEIYIKRRERDRG